jgi:hypothetical protein
MVLFSGMEKTSHWAALYFVALMTFGKKNTRSSNPLIFVSI